MDGHRPTMSIFTAVLHNKTTANKFANRFPYSKLISFNVVN